MGTHHETHPWLTYQVNLGRLPATFWMAIGEAISKCEHMARVPLRNDVSQDLYALYLAKGVHATTAIEGNTLSEEQVLHEIQGELKLPESQEYQRQEIANIIDACVEIEGRVFSHRRDGRLRYEDILEYNEMVLRQLDLEEGVVPGHIREHPVVVGNVYKGPPAGECEALLRRMCDWLNSDDFFGLHEQYGIGASLIRAVLAHLYIAWIHPFGDGNGRTARLVEFQVLVASGVPSPSAHLLSNHYNATRMLYYRQLREASQNGGDVGPFLCYAVDGFVATIREQIRSLLEDYLQDLVWRDFVDVQLQDESDTLATRHKELLVALFRARVPIQRGALTTLTARLVELYRGKSSKTLSRDLNALKDRDLIAVKGGMFEANRSRIMHFLPPTTDLPLGPPSRHEAPDREG